MNILKAEHFHKLSINEKIEKLQELYNQISPDFQVRGIIPQEGATLDEIATGLYSIISIYKEYFDNGNSHPRVHELIIDDNDF